MASYSTLDHTADLGIRVFGKTRKHVFQNAGKALFDLLVSKKSRNPGLACKISVSGLDLPDLLVNWLRELLSLWTLENRIVTAVDIEILDERSLVAAVKTVALNLGQDELHHDIKAVTYHQADVKPVAHGWEATVIFDV